MYQTTTFPTLFLSIFMHFSTFTERKGVFILSICPLSLGVLFSPAPLLFCPACGASSCCCCPPALCSCSSAGPLQAASRSLSRSPGGDKDIVHCVYTGRDVVKCCTWIIDTLPHQCRVIPRNFDTGLWTEWKGVTVLCYLHLNFFCV